MKAPKILLAGLLAFSSAGVSKAQTVVHITGSTAARAAVQQAILDMMPGCQYAYSGTSFTGANQSIFTGSVVTSNGSVPAIIKTSWSGSLAGIETVSQAYPSTVSTFLTNTTSQSTSGTSNAPGVYDPPVQPEVCMNDGPQFDSQYPYPALAETEVGVVSFVFAKSSKGVSSAPGLTNMTPLLAQALWQNGSLPLSMWTGNSNDLNTTVYATGRDPDSGTRKIAFLETGVQTFNSIPPVFQDVIQYEPTNASGVVSRSNPGAITGQTIWPPLTNLDGLNFPAGDGGYSSGGDVAVALYDSGPNIYVSYLGLADDASVTNVLGPAANLAYNGIYYSHATAQNGQYTYWMYEYLGYLPSYISTVPNAQNIADTLAVQVSKEVNISLVGETLGQMNVVRQQEGGVVTPR